MTAKLEVTFTTPGQMILTLRHIMGYSQKDFAKELGISSNTIYHWEAEKVNPGAQKLFEIIQACGYTIRLEKLTEET